MVWDDRPVERAATTGTGGPAGRPSDRDNASTDGKRDPGKAGSGRSSGSSVGLSSGHKQVVDDPDHELLVHRQSEGSALGVPPSTPTPSTLARSHSRELPSRTERSRTDHVVLCWTSCRWTRRSKGCRGA
jgi:hypothetical protein